MVRTYMPQLVASVLNAQPAEIIGIILHQKFHESVQDFIPKQGAASTATFLDCVTNLIPKSTAIPEEHAPVPTVSPADLVTGLPDAKKPNGAQPSNNPMSSSVMVTPSHHTTWLAMTPAAAAKMSTSG